MRRILLLFLVPFALSLVSSAYAFRCGSRNQNLATEGMHKFQILADCGEPASREVVGYDKNRVIEEWLYIIDDSVNQQMYLIRFDQEGIAKQIEWLGKIE